MATAYHWQVSNVDHHGDITETTVSETLSEARGVAKRFGPSAVIELVRETDRGRAWATMTQAGLPDQFDDGTAMPRRFLA